MKIYTLYLTEIVAEIACLCKYELFENSYMGKNFNMFRYFKFYDGDHDVYHEVQLYGGMVK